MDNQSTPIKFTPVKGSYYRSEGSDKPTGSPKSEKDFKKIYRSDEDGEADTNGAVDEKPEQDTEIDTIAMSEHGLAPAKEKMPVPASPFALVAHPHPPTKGPELKKNPTTVKHEAINSSQSEDVEKVDQSAYQPVSEIDDDNDPDNLYDVIAEAPPIDKSSRVVKFESPDVANAAPVAVEQPTPEKIVPVKPQDQRIFTENVDKESKSDNFNNQFTREQPDLAYINPLAVAMPQAPITTAEVKAETPVPTANLQALVEKLVKELSVIKQGDKTETTLVIDNPPQFKGMRIVVTNFETANNEFNLKFENLTQAAKQILDTQQNRADLLSNLERKGYNVHIFITTTYSESNPLTMNVDTPAREREKQDDSERDQPRDQRQRKGEQQT